MKLITTFLLCGLCIGFLFPKPSLAAIEQPFGGIVLFSLPCTCSYGMAITFILLRPNPPFPLFGTLHYMPGVSFLHPNYMIGVPSKWHLGKYIPAVGSCLMTATPCVPYPISGIITRVGTSG